MYSPFIIICSIQQTFHIINVSPQMASYQKEKLFLPTGLVFRKYGVIIIETRMIHIYIPNSKRPVV